MLPPPPSSNPPPAGVAAPGHNVDPNLAALLAKTIENQSSLIEMQNEQKQGSETGKRHWENMNPLNKKVIRVLHVNSTTQKRAPSKPNSVYLEFLCTRKDNILSQIEHIIYHGQRMDIQVDKNLAESLWHGNLLNDNPGVPRRLSPLFCGPRRLITNDMSEHEWNVREQSKNLTAAMITKATTSEIFKPTNEHELLLMTQNFRGLLLFVSGDRSAVVEAMSKVIISIQRNGMHIR